MRVVSNGNSYSDGSPNPGWSVAGGMAGCTKVSTSAPASRAKTGSKAGSPR
jgi:hypothetical protein